MRFLPAAVLLALLLVQGLLFITESSQTSDETAHLLAGYAYLRTGNFLAYTGESHRLRGAAGHATCDTSTPSVRRLGDDPS